MSCTIVRNVGGGVGSVGERADEGDESVCLETLSPVVPPPPDSAGDDDDKDLIRTGICVADPFPLHPKVNGFSLRLSRPLPAVKSSLLSSVADISGTELKLSSVHCPHPGVTTPFDSDPHFCTLSSAPVCRLVAHTTSGNITDNGFLGAALADFPDVEYVAREATHVKLLQGKASRMALSMVFLFYFMD